MYQEPHVRYDQAAESKLHVRLSAARDCRA